MRKFKVKNKTNKSQPTNQQTTSFMNCHNSSSPTNLTSPTAVSTIIIPQMSCWTHNLKGQSNYLKDLKEFKEDMEQLKLQEDKKMFE